MKSTIQLSTFCHKIVTFASFRIFVIKIDDYCFKIAAFSRKSATSDAELAAQVILQKRSPDQRKGGGA